MAMDDRQFRLMMDLQTKQAQLRGRRLYMQTAIDEMKAISRLLYEKFGERGLIEADPKRPGIFFCGWYDRVYPKEHPHKDRLRMLPFIGTSHREIVEQIALMESFR